MITPNEGSVYGRGGEIWTPDILLPKQARYRTALHPELKIKNGFLSNNLKPILLL